MTGVDENIGRIINELKRLGLFKEEFYKLKYCSTVVYMVPRA
jgi:hypothetical protein